MRNVRRKVAERRLDDALKALEREAIASSTLAGYGRASYPMARAEDLVVFKALAARPKDIEDAAALILMHPAMDLGRVRERGRRARRNR